MKKNLKGHHRNPFCESVIENDFESFYDLLLSGIDVDIVDNNGLTALYYAAQWGRLEMARCLIERGANIEHVDDFGNTPLMRACLTFNRNGVDMIALLISAGANIDAQNYSGNSPRSLSKIMTGFPDINSFLKK